MLANPRLRFLAVDRGVWSFELLPDDEKAAVAPFAPSVETALRHRHYDGGKGSGAQKIRSAAEIHTDGYGWLVRASAGVASLRSPLLHRSQTEPTPLMVAGSMTIS